MSPAHPFRHSGNVIRVGAQSCCAFGQITACLSGVVGKFRQMV